jgi:predicted metal-binding protein
LKLCEPQPSARARVELIVCETCGSAERETHGSTRGERLLAQLTAAQASAPAADIELSSVRCLWACSRSCAVHLRSPGRVGYVLCELEPSALTAQALLEYAAMYGASPDGAVPFKTWPQPLRGHFMCRIPATPIPED